MKKLDEVYMMITPDGEGIVYSGCAESPGILWRRVIEDNWLGTGMTKALLTKQGYRVKKVKVYL